MEEVTVNEPRWRRPPVEYVRLVPREVVLGPPRRVCITPGCQRTLSRLNPCQQCFRCQPRSTAYAIPRGPRPEVDRARSR